MWEAVTARTQAVATLQAAAAAPVAHAYLLVGSRGFGRVGRRRGPSPRDHRRDGRRAPRALVARGAHPDVVEFEPTTATYTLANEIRSPRAGETARRDTVAAAGDPRDPQGADRGRPQGRHGPRRGPHGTDCRQHAAQEHRGAAAAHGRAAAHRPARRIARHDPVAVPARRLRVRAARAIGATSRLCGRVRGRSWRASTAGPAPPSSWWRGSKRRSPRPAPRRRPRPRTSSRSSTPTSRRAAIRRGPPAGLRSRLRTGSGRSCDAPRPMR